MDTSLTLSLQAVADNTWQFGTYLPVGEGNLLAVNSYLIKAQQPVLVDTGLAALQDEYLMYLRQCIDPRQIAWIWITHMDPDHIGNLAALLEIAPNAKIVTSFLGAGKLGLLGLPTEQVKLIEEGESLDVGDRRLTAIRPPSYDAPETLACWDSSTKALFSSDCFGALVTKPVVQANSLSQRELLEGMVSWAKIDTPWLAVCTWYNTYQTHKKFFECQPSIVLSSHLAPFVGDHKHLFLQAFTQETLVA